MYRAPVPLQTWSGQLQGNALKTGAATGGRFMRHQLNRGSYGQVLILGVDDKACNRNMGEYTPFELYYYSWLCEVPNSPGLSKQMCDDIIRMSRTVVAGQRGHHDLLSSKAYKTIGCAFAPNTGVQQCAGWKSVWACDLGY
ncbi:hypothetical protein K402DRAFT_391657 [Aulographum hederae CBS 113979]|uniref:SCP domain-containing protein n=1 Tax=Aulographum hederae CBS 113979 TaxID=1176131 RepID=A0A6G1H5C6_9PEZI|nr:hypothetical protein K402DRAFT_391657 [Aulographum hederae CBS 113979]